MGKQAKTSTAASDHSHDAAEAAGQGHHHHRFLHGLHQHHQQMQPKQAQPAPRTVNRLECSSEEDINDSADAFIKRFRQQLDLQRLQSIENYQQMLARGL